MKIMFLVAAAALMIGAADGEQVRLQLNADTEREAVCQDRITHARAESGLPALDRRTASPDAPLFFAAVDQRLDGCGVLVMRHDLQDIRPVPAIPRDQPLFMQAR